MRKRKNNHYDYNDIIGEKCGKWKVIAYIGRVDEQHRYLCECTCGNKGIMRRYDFEHQRSSCCKHCAQDEHVIDMTGKTVNMLTVIGVSTSPSKWKEKRWDCICKCGKKQLFVDRR